MGRFQSLELQRLALRETEPGEYYSLKPSRLSATCRLLLACWSYRHPGLASSAPGRQGSELGPEHMGKRPMVPKTNPLQEHMSKFPGFEKRDRSGPLLKEPLGVCLSSHYLDSQMERSWGDLGTPLHNRAESPFTEEPGSHGLAWGIWMAVSALASSSWPELSGSEFSDCALP